MGTAQGCPQRADPDRSHVSVGQPAEGTGSERSLSFTVSAHPCSSLVHVLPMCSQRQIKGIETKKKSGYARLRLWICFDGCSPSPPVDAEILLPVAARQGTERCWGQLRARCTPGWVGPQRLQGPGSCRGSCLQDSQSCLLQSKQQTSARECTVLSLQH